MIPVTTPYLPSREKLEEYIDGIYERKWLTNNGPLVQELTQRLEKHLGVENLLLVSNGTLALQIAYRVLGIHEKFDNQSPQAITTPFSFIATASSLKWEGIDPIFVDINPDTWCIDPKNIESAITSKTRAIVPVHVFGNPCDVESIQTIADHYGIKVVYDAAHAFDVTYKGKSILKYGDASILSLHATKLFHSVEGGVIIFKRKEDFEKAKKLINFGISSPDCIDELGINAKMGEFHAAMGLCVLDEISGVKAKRRKIWESYSQTLSNTIVMQKWSDYAVNNCAYFPIVLSSENDVLNLIQNLAVKDIQLRRYFHPSLESISALGDYKELPISKNISSRVICLPLYSSLNVNEVLPSLRKYLNIFEVFSLRDFPNHLIVEFIYSMDKFFNPPIGKQVSLEEYVEKLKENGYILGVLDNEHNVVGLIGFYANDELNYKAFISYLSIDPHYKGKGLAKLLIRAACGICVEENMKTCGVTTWSGNKSALNLYRKIGFSEINRKQDRNRIAVYLEMALEKFF